MLAPPLAPLAAWPQFVAWRIETRPNAQGEQVETKVPYSPITGRGASSTDPAHWGTHEQAATFAAAHGMDGIGFVFTERDPFFFIDIDKALQPDRSWSMLAQEMCARFAGAAIEVSQSGTGLHIIGSCAKGFDHRNKNTPLKLELYTKERFVALTGLQAVGNAATRLDAPLAAAVAQFFTRDVADQMADTWTTVPDPAWRGPDDDLELLDRIFNSGARTAAAAFGGGKDGPSFKDLWTANSQILGSRWPPNNPGDGFDHSNADQSLANLLAFWTGRNCDRIERLMRMSALARSKWDTHHTYLQTTILKAAGYVTNVYVERTAAASAVPPPPPVDPAVVEAAGFTPREALGPIMLANVQMRYFADCVYLVSLNKVLTPDGSLLDQARFNVVYGGHKFAISADNQSTSTSAWTAFTESGHFTTPIADRLCFRPEHGAGGVVVDSGKRLANAYFPADVEETEGDPSPFLDHVRRMLPHGRDAEILLTYMASVKQNPGMKAQWWPVVQGAEGNFKSFLLTIMAHAVGTHYAHLPNMAKMIRNGSNFNGWVERKLFLGLDEVYGAHRREFFEDFKTTITNRSIPIEGKGLEEVTGDNRANGMIVTNHQDGVPVMGRNRRYAAFFCAQQTPEDMLRDGMDAAYIANLKNWLLGHGPYAAHGANYGIRVVIHYLARKPLDADIDPNQLAIRPPETTSTAAALVAGRGRVEQEVQEAIEEERTGFAGGWVSSIYLDRLIEQKRFNVAVNKRRELMQSLGYDYHSALMTTSNPGRVTRVVGPDNGKPRLYVRMGSVAALNLSDPDSVAKAYSDAQMRTMSEKSAGGVAFNK